MAAQVALRRHQTNRDEEDSAASAGEGSSNDISGDGKKKSAPMDKSLKTMQQYSHSKQVLHSYKSRLRTLQQQQQQR
uniref:Protein max n=1 Tax=Macrostomum lignano TaxID=282301 RepID=A0A1I8IHR1_9PLAT